MRTQTNKPEGSGGILQSVLVALQMDSGAAKQIQQMRWIDEQVLGVQHIEARANHGLSVGVDAVLAVRRKGGAAVVNANVEHASKLRHRVEEEASHVGRGKRDGHAPGKHVDDIRKPGALSAHQHVCIQTGLHLVFRLHQLQLLLGIHEFALVLHEEAPDLLHVHDRSPREVAVHRFALQHQHVRRGELRRGLGRERVAVELVGGRAERIRLRHGGEDAAVGEGDDAADADLRVRRALRTNGVAEADHPLRVHGVHLLQKIRLEGVAIKQRGSDVKVAGDPGIHGIALVLGEEDGPNGGIRRTVVQIVVHKVEYLRKVGDVAIRVKHHDVHAPLLHPVVALQRLRPVLRKTPRLRGKVRCLDNDVALTIWDALLVHIGLIRGKHVGVPLVDVVAHIVEHHEFYTAHPVHHPDRRVLALTRLESVQFGGIVPIPLLFCFKAFDSLLESRIPTRKAAHLPLPRWNPEIHGNRITVRNVRYKRQIGLLRWDWRSISQERLLLLHRHCLPFTQVVGNTTCDSDRRKPQSRPMAQNPYVDDESNPQQYEQAPGIQSQQSVFHYVKGVGTPWIIQVIGKGVLLWVCMGFGGVPHRLL